MSLLRCVSIVTLFLFAFFFMSLGTLSAEKTAWDAASHWIFDHHILWWSSAHADADAGDSGYYRVWAHCGSGKNDYSGGPLSWYFESKGLVSRENRPARRRAFTPFFIVLQFVAHSPNRVTIVGFITKR